MMRSKVLGAVLVVGLLAVAAAAAEAAVAADRGGDFFAVLPDATLDASVPTISSVTGAGWGEAITSPDDVVSYARALAAAAPQRVSVVEYARSLEGRPLVLLVVTSEPNHAHLEEIRRRLVALGDPRQQTAAAVETGLEELPAVVWIACSVHGDEASGGDAGLALAYYLGAARTAEVRALLDRTVVVIDPMQNPDGRARFVASTRQARGIDPDPDPASAEHVQPWPGGRYSHDLFDLNRDWFAMTHPETAGRVRWMRRWPPVAAADLHEMGSEQGYFFSPPARPLNPLLSEDQVQLWDLIGRGNASAFDARGWRYWTRELFDAFYPGYGESWPLYSGAVGMTFEQASSRGLVMRLDNGTLLRYRATVQHHLVSSFATVRTVAENRRRFVEAWVGYRRAVVDEGRSGDVRGWMLRRGGLAHRLATLLVRHGIEVYETDAGFVVPKGQPEGRLAEVLLERSIPIPHDFVVEQERRYEKRLPDQFYDATAWSLPLLWSVPVEPLRRLPERRGGAALTADDTPIGAVVGDGRVAFLLPWDGTAVPVLARLLRDGIRVEAAGKPFTLAGKRYGTGTLVVPRAGNVEGLRERLETIATDTGATFVGADTGYVEEGIDLGSTQVRTVRPPRIVLLWAEPTSPTGVGGLRYALERWAGYPVTVVRTATLSRLDLEDVDVLVVPDARRGYRDAFGKDQVARISAWVRDGGVLIGVGSGAAWLAGEDVALLSSRLLHRGESGEQPAAAKDGDAAADDAARRRSIVPENERPPQVPGAILRVNLDPDSWLAAGFPDGSVDALVSSSRVFAPVTLDRGVNVGVYADRDDLVQSGFVFPASLELLPGAAFLMEESHGDGKVVAFAEDPAARGYTMSTMMLLANAVFFGTAF